MKNTKIKILPMTLFMFKKNFNLIIEDVDLVIDAYSVYLDSNKDRHHYGNGSLEEWLDKEAKIYTEQELRKLNPEGV